MIGSVRHAFVEFVPAHDAARFDAAARILFATGLTETPEKVSVLGGRGEPGDAHGYPPRDAIVTAHYPGGRSIAIAPSKHPRPAVIRGTAGSIELSGDAGEGFTASNWAGADHALSIGRHTANLIERAGAAWRMATGSPSRRA